MNYLLKYIIFILPLILSSCSKNDKNIETSVSKTSPILIEDMNTKEKNDKSSFDKLKPKPESVNKNVRIKFHKKIGNSGLKVDTLLVNYKEWLRSANYPKCNSKEFNVPEVLNNKLSIEYENSSENTNLYDGNLFCLKNFNFKNIPFSRIIYARNEGGHTSDEISLKVITTDNLVFTLPLCFEYGRDGYSKVVEAKIENETLFHRKITERFGWSNTHPDSLAKQPQKITKEIYSIEKNGVVKRTSQQIVELNMESY